MNKSLKEKLESDFETSVKVPKENRWIVTVGKNRVLSILKFLKNEGFNHLALISCVDWIEEEELELIYILSSYLPDMDKLHLTVKTRISRKNPEFETVISVFGNAEPYERELHEFFGINFEGHPGLEHLFLDRDYEIPPFRKDFDTRKYVEESFESVPSRREEECQREN